MTFRCLGGDELVEFLHGYHDLFARTPSSYLLELNAAHRHGNLRRWAALLDNALPYAERLGVDRLTPEVVDLAMVFLTEGPDDDEDEAAA